MQCRATPTCAALLLPTIASRSARIISKFIMRFERLNALGARWRQKAERDIFADDGKSSTFCYFLCRNFITHPCCSPAFPSLSALFGRSHRRGCCCFAVIYRKRTPMVT